MVLQNEISWKSKSQYYKSLLIIGAYLWWTLNSIKYRCIIRQPEIFQAKGTFNCTLIWNKVNLNVSVFDIVFNKAIYYKNEQF